jgi:16S rRNA (cytidine1402-2'-O)-methyltransferase
VSSGRLIVCATPIGNLGDVTARVVEALGEADTIAAEDTRVTRKLLARYGISTPLEAYHAHNLETRTPALVERIESGEDVALVSDAGTPGISDPGAHLVDACIDAGLEVEVLPGPSAIITALVASGLPTHAFYFGGFLPRKAGPRARKLETVAELDASLIFYESPRRTAATLAAIAEALPGRRAAMCRELTKMHEEVARGAIEELAGSLAERELKGEVVLVVGPPSRKGRPELDAGDVRARVQAHVVEGASMKDAIRRVVEETGWPKNDVYDAAHADSDAETS